MESNLSTLFDSSEANIELARRIQIISDSRSGGLAAFFDEAEKEQSAFEEAMAAAAEQELREIFGEAVVYAQAKRANSKS